MKSLAVTWFEDPRNFAANGNGGELNAVESRFVSLNETRKLTIKSILGCFHGRNLLQRYSETKTSSRNSKKSSRRKRIVFAQQLGTLRCSSLKALLQYFAHSA
ncbi:unnamed protein product, partial [Ectocarpus sp. 13 AM-2016]